MSDNVSMTTVTCPGSAMLRFTTTAPPAGGIYTFDAKINGNPLDARSSTPQWQTVFPWGREAVIVTGDTTSAECVPAATSTTLGHAVTAQPVPAPAVLAYTGGGLTAALLGVSLFAAGVSMHAATQYIRARIIPTKESA